MKNLKKKLPQNLNVSYTKINILFFATIIAAVCEKSLPEKLCHYDDNEKISHKRKNHCKT